MGIPNATTWLRIYLGTFCVGLIPLVLLAKDYIRRRDNFFLGQEAKNYDSRGDSLSINCQVIRQGLRYRPTQNIGTNTRLKWCRDQLLCASGQIPLTCPDSQDSCFDDLCHSLVLVCVVTLFLLAPSKIQSHGTTRWSFFSTSHSSYWWVLLGRLNPSLGLYDCY